MKSSSFKSSQWILTSRSILILTVRYFRSNMGLKPLFHLTICLLSMRWNSFVHLFFFCFWMAGKILRKQCQTALPAGFSLPRLLYLTGDDRRQTPEPDSVSALFPYSEFSQLQLCRGFSCRGSRPSLPELCGGSKGVWAAEQHLGKSRPTPGGL